MKILVSQNANIFNEYQMMQSVSEVTGANIKPVPQCEIVNCTWLLPLWQ